MVELNTAAILAKVDEFKNNSENKSLVEGKSDKEIISIMIATGVLPNNIGEISLFKCDDGFEIPGLSVESNGEEFSCVPEGSYKKPVFMGTYGQKMTCNDLKYQYEEAMRTYQLIDAQQGWSGEVANIARESETTRGYISASGIVHAGYNPQAPTNTRRDVFKALDQAKAEYQELEKAGNISEQAFCDKFYELYDIEYNEENIATFEENRMLYTIALDYKQQQEAYTKEHELLLSEVPLREEGKFVGKGGYYQVTATKEQVYEREFNKLVREIGEALPYSSVDNSLLDDEIKNEVREKLRDKYPEDKDFNENWPRLLSSEPEILQEVSAKILDKKIEQIKYNKLVQEIMVGLPDNSDYQALLDDEIKNEVREKLRDKYPEDKDFNENWPGLLSSEPEILQEVSAKLLNKKIAKGEKSPTTIEEKFEILKDIAKHSWQTYSVLIAQLTSGNIVELDYKQQQKAYAKEHSLLLKDKPLMEERKATKEQVYEREFNKLAQEFGEVQPNATETKTQLKEQYPDEKEFNEKWTEFCVNALNQYIEQSEKAHSTIEEKFEILKDIAQETYQSIADGGLGRLKAEYDKTYVLAYGTKTDAMKKVDEFYIAQQIGSAWAKNITMAAGITVISVLTFGTGTVPAVEAAAKVAGIAAGSTVFTEVSDELTKKGNIQAFAEGGLSAYVKSVGRNADWRRIATATVSSGTMMLAIGGLTYPIANLVRLGATAAGLTGEALDIATGVGTNAVVSGGMLGATKLMKGEVTTEDAVFIVIMAVIGSTIQVVQINKAYAARAHAQLMKDIANAKGVLGFNEGEEITQELVMQRYRKIVKANFNKGLWNTDMALVRGAKEILLANLRLANSMTAQTVLSNTPVQVQQPALPQPTVAGTAEGTSQALVLASSVNPQPVIPTNYVPPTVESYRIIGEKAVATDNVQQQTTKTSLFQQQEGTVPQEISTSSASGLKFPSYMKQPQTIATQQQIDDFHKLVLKDIEECLKDYEQCPQFPTIESFKEYLEKMGADYENSFKNNPEGTKIIFDIAMNRYLNTEELPRMVKAASQYPEAVRELLELKDDNGNYYIGEIFRGFEEFNFTHFAEMYNSHPEKVKQAMVDFLDPGPYKDRTVFTLRELDLSTTGAITDAKYFNSILDIYGQRNAAYLTTLHTKYPEAVEFLVEIDKNKPSKYSPSSIDKFDGADLCEMYNKYPEAMKKLFTLKHSNDKNENDFLWIELSGNYYRIPEDLLKMIDKNPQAFEDLSKVVYYPSSGSRAITTYLSPDRICAIAKFYNNNNKTNIQNLIRASHNELSIEALEVLSNMSPEQQPIICELVRNGYLRMSVRSTYNDNAGKYTYQTEEYKQYVLDQIEAYDNCQLLYEALKNPSSDNYSYDDEIITALTKAMGDAGKSGLYTQEDLLAICKRLRYCPKELEIKISNLMHINKTGTRYTPSQIIELLMIDTKVNWKFFNEIDDGFFAERPSIEDLLVDKINNATEIEPLRAYIDALNIHYKNTNTTSSYSNIEELTTGRLKARDEVEARMQKKLEKTTSEPEPPKNPMFSFMTKDYIIEQHLRSAMASYDKFNKQFVQAGFSQDFIEQICIEANADIYSEMIDGLTECIKKGKYDMDSVTDVVYEAFYHHYGKAPTTEQMQAYFDTLLKNWNIGKDLDYVLEHPNEAKNISFVLDENGGLTTINKGDVTPQKPAYEAPEVAEIKVGPESDVMSSASEPQQTSMALKYKNTVLNPKARASVKLLKDTYNCDIEILPNGKANIGGQEFDIGDLDKSGVAEIVRSTFDPSYKPSSVSISVKQQNSPEVTKLRTALKEAYGTGTQAVPSKPATISGRKAIVPASMRPTTGKIGSVDVTVASGDLTMIKADAYLVPEFTDCASEGGVGGAVWRKGAGAGMEAYEKYVAEKGEQDFGSVVVTEAGGGNSSKLIHAVTVGSGAENEFQTVQTAVYNALKEAQAQGIKSIVIPELGTGIIGSLTGEQSAQAIMAGIQQFNAEGGTMDVSLVIYGNNDHYNTFVETMNTQTYANAKPVTGTKEFDTGAWLKEMVDYGNVTPQKPTQPVIKANLADVDPLLDFTNKTASEVTSALKQYAEKNGLEFKNEMTRFGSEDRLYNSAGKVVLAVTTSENEVDFVEKYEYTQNGKDLAKTTYANGKVADNIEYFYDADGNIKYSTKTALHYNIDGTREIKSSLAIWENSEGTIDFGRFYTPEELSSQYGIKVNTEIFEATASKAPTTAPSVKYAKQPEVAELELTVSEEAQSYAQKLMEIENKYSTQSDAETFINEPSEQIAIFRELLEKGYDYIEGNTPVKLSEQTDETLLKIAEKYKPEEGYTPSSAYEKTCAELEKRRVTIPDNTGKPAYEAPEVAEIKVGPESDVMSSASEPQQTSMALKYKNTVLNPKARASVKLLKDTYNCDIEILPNGKANIGGQEFDIGDLDKSGVAEIVRSTFDPSYKPSSVSISVKQQNSTVVTSLRKAIEKAYGTGGKAAIAILKQKLSDEPVSSLLAAWKMTAKNSDLGRAVAALLVEKRYTYKPESDVWIAPAEKTDQPNARQTIFNNAGFTASVIANLKQEYGSQLIDEVLNMIEYLENETANGKPITQDLVNRAVNKYSCGGFVLPMRQRYIIANYWTKGVDVCRAFGEEPPTDVVAKDNVEGLKVYDAETRVAQTTTTAVKSSPRTKESLLSTESPVKYDTNYFENWAKENNLELSYENNGKIAIFEDEQGNRIRCITKDDYSKDNKISDDRIYYYDENNNVTAKRIYYAYKNQTIILLFDNPRDIASIDAIRHNDGLWYDNKTGRLLSDNPVTGKPQKTEYEAPEVAEIKVGPESDVMSSASEPKRNVFSSTISKIKEFFKGNSAKTQSVGVSKELTKQQVLSDAEKYGGTITHDGGKIIVEQQYGSDKRPIEQGSYFRKIVYSENSDMPTEVITQAKNSPWTYQSAQRSVLQEDGSYSHYILNQANKFGVEYKGYDLNGNAIPGIKQEINIIGLNGEIYDSYTPEQIANISSVETYHAEDNSAARHLDIQNALKIGESPRQELAMGYGIDAAYTIKLLIQRASRMTNNN